MKFIQLSVTPSTVRVDLATMQQKSSPFFQGFQGVVPYWSGNRPINWRRDASSPVFSYGGGVATTALSKTTNLSLYRVSHNFCKGQRRKKWLGRSSATGCCKMFRYVIDIGTNLTSPRHTNFPKEVLKWHTLYIISSLFCAGLHRDLQTTTFIIGTI